MHSAGGYREVTFAAIAFGVIFGAIMNVAITYAGLKIGFTIGGSAIAAVLGFGVLRGILRRGSILENNIGQTIASAVNTSNSGVIFTVPVLFLMGYELALGDRDFWTICLACVAGAILGTLFIIPLRKQMIDIERLRFPSPTGVAAILKSPGAGPAKAVVLLVGCIVGALIYLPAGLPSIRYEAALEDLDALVDRDRLTPQERDRTREIAAMIERKEAPAELIARGELVQKQRDLRQQVEEAREEGAENLRELRRQLDEADEAVAAAATGSRFNDDLALSAYQAASGKEDWSILRHRKNGWAARTFFGYADIPWRLPAEIDEEATQTAREANPEAAAVLTEYVDRNRDGKPDMRFGDSLIDFGRWFGIPLEFPFILAIAPFALGAGYITGRAGLFVLAGGILAYFFINPLAFNLDWIPVTVQSHAVADYGRGQFTRPLGIGMLLGGALMGVLFSLPAIKEAIKSIALSSRLKAGSDELGLKTIGLAAIGGLIVLFIAADVMGKTPINPRVCPVTSEPVDRNVPVVEYRGYSIGFATADAAQTWSQDWTDEQRDQFLESRHAKPGLLAGLNPHLRAAIIAIVGAIWIWFAGIIISQCAGMTDWSPISGMSLLTVVLVLMLAGSGAVLGAVLLGAALCVAITLASDMMGDLKTGHLVGAIPKRQQITELAVVAIGPIIAMVTLMIIVQANRAQFGVDIGPGTDTVAPQAQALQAVITGVQGGEMPYALYGMGAIVGCLLGLGAFSGLGVLIGISMFLPFFYIATYGVGCLINIGVKKVKGAAWAEGWGVPFAAGLIVGEGILSVLINFIVLIREA